jgi:uncharacterized membrane protein YfcA
MEILLIATVALLASMLTFFSGFGLGTILTPVFVLFFPLDLAIALTAVVHFLNNLFKIVLVHKHIAWRIALLFGIPAILGAFFGAKTLVALDTSSVLYSYQLGTSTFYIEAVKLTIAILMILFALMELLPQTKTFQISTKWLSLGGLLSGFFGGLSGHQGALRSIFLVKCGLNKNAFVATGVVIALCIDVARLRVYTQYQLLAALKTHGFLLSITILAAFGGALIGKQLLQKTTIDLVQQLVSILLLVFAFLLGAGVL